MKRILTGLILVLMTLSILMGCTADVGSITTPSASESVAVQEPVTPLSLWYWGIQRPDLGPDQYLDMVNEWNAARPDIQIDVTAYDIEEYKSKIKTSLAAGEAPDIYYMWSGSFVRPYLRTGNMLPLNEYISDDLRGRIKPGMWEQCMDAGNIYSIPILSYVANLYCNTELFSQAGAEIPKTYDELVTAVKAFRKAGITPIALGEKDRWPGMYWYNILAMRSAGLKDTRDALQYPALFERNAFLKAAEMLVELNSLDAFSPEAFEWGFVEMVDSFRNGNAAMMYQGVWVDTIIEDEESPTRDKVTVVPFPIVVGGNGSAYEFLGGNIDSFYIRADTPYPEEAFEVLLHISEKAGREGEADGLGISCWNLPPEDRSQVPPLAAQSIALMESGQSFLGWWDTILPATSAETHKSLVADLLDNRVTAEEFSSEMSKMIGAQP